MSVILSSSWFNIALSFLIIIFSGYLHHLRNNDGSKGAIISMRVLLLVMVGVLVFTVVQSFY